MKLFNIYPIKNQKHYLHDDYAMILAHLLEKNLYDYKQLNSNRYIIMDNGAYEHARVSASLKDLIDLANKSKIVVDEIVIPDAIGDYEATKKLYYDNYRYMLEYADDFQFMYVAHVSNLDELKEAIEMVNSVEDVALTLGIPKHCKLDRTCDEAIELYKTCQVPIHFLGIKKSYSELIKVKDIIRSCDTVQLLYLARDNDINCNNLIEQTRKGPVIDLETDSVDDNKIREMKKVMHKELVSNGILR